MAKKTTTKKTIKPAQTTKSVATKRTRTRKVAPKVRDSVKENVIAVQEENEFLVEKQSVNQKPFKLRKLYIVAAVIIIILGYALYSYRSLFVAAVVNGQPISRLTVVQAAEKQSGKQALDTLVRNALIEQEARRENVTVSDKEIDDQMKTVQSKLASQGQNIDQVLAMQGMTKDDLRKLVRLDKLVQKMVGKNVKVTDKQIDDYISQNQASLPQNQDQSKLRQTVKAQLEQQALQQNVQTWLSSLQSKAKILYFVQY